MKSLIDFKPPDDECILGFTGQYQFLSNSYPTPVKHRNIDDPGVDLTLPTATHCYYYSIAANKSDRIAILNAATPEEATEIGIRSAKYPKYEHYEEALANKMTQILYGKFSILELIQKLRDTRLLYLENTNDYNDTFWGICGGKGNNYLGAALMTVRWNLEWMHQVFIRDNPDARKSGVSAFGTSVMRQLI